MRKDCKRSTGSQTGWKTPHQSVFRISAGQVVVLSPLRGCRITHRSLPRNPFASDVLAADSAPLIAPLSLPSECCCLALRSQLNNFPPVRRLALRSQRRLRSTPALRSGIFPVALPARPQSLFAHLLQSPGLPPAPRIGTLDRQTFGCLSFKASETRRDNYLSNLMDYCQHLPQDSDLSL